MWMLKINKHRPDWFLVSLFINVLEKDGGGNNKNMCAEFSNSSGLLCHMPPTSNNIIALIGLIHCDVVAVVIVDAAVVVRSEKTFLRFYYLIDIIINA